MSLIGPNQMFNNPVNIKNDAITLALNVLQMSKVEFTSFSIMELRNMKSNMSNNGLMNCALNILIFYKSEEDRFNGFSPKQHNMNFIDNKSDLFGPHLRGQFNVNNRPDIFEPKFEPKLNNSLDLLNKQFI